ncbi:MULTISPECIES: hypothetical protein [Vibrio]|uniref:hypothetical protein n=1 Tax=Vibrio TaxID=662 RepID=UPI00015401C6|nr:MULTISPECIES: hypothetical protein [Vibrio]EDL55958.1 hypothetical protein VSAK1_18207 [Vibrio mediterranei AK1]MCY9852519.1 hypothetical protein [Vibrio mediterranei]MDA0106947.1 hypothetical protein [Vibrio sp. La 4.2.2]NUW74221.1 hypothetical protein [Vibrio mediterranei]USE02880.1 hypothetical protein JKJ11_24905 [Vibrio sp. SCSIO 43133]
MFRLLKHSLLVTSAVPTLAFASERQSSDRLKLGPQEVPLYLLGTDLKPYHDVAKPNE